MKETLSKLNECDKAKKSVEASIESFERQAREQLYHFWEAESQLATTWAIIFELKKELDQKTKDMVKIEQVAFDLGQKEIETHLKSKIPVVC